MSEPITRLNYLPIVKVNGVPCILIPTTKNVKYDADMTLKDALDIFYAQVDSTAAAAAETDEALNTVEEWLQTNYNYTPPTTTTPEQSEYLNSNFIALVPASN